MSGRLRCPSCRAVFEIRQQDRGQKVPCPECSKLLAIPAKAGRPPLSPPSEGGARGGSDRTRAGPPPLPAGATSAKGNVGDRKKSVKKKKSKVGLRGVWLGVSLVILGACGAAAVVMYLQKQPEPVVTAPTVPPLADAGGDLWPVGPGDAALAMRENTIPRKPEALADLDVPMPRLPAIVAKDPPPADIQPEAVRKVKRCTALLRVQMADGRGGEGSGFCAVEPGIIVTNAHVVGMLTAGSLRPKHLEVVLYSGEPNEKRVTGEVIGVDRRSDLAVVRVPISDDLPPPLEVRSAADLVEVQKVYIFGFPFGSRLGKDITVSSSTVSSLRKDRMGAIERVQVNGGMHPGNSGGPVVDARGHVVAVSVSVITGTQLNFGVPGDFVQAIVGGRFLVASLGDPYIDGQDLKMNYEVTLLDPLKRIKAVQLASWYGSPGQPRTQHSVKLGDGPKQLVDLTIKDGKARGVLTLPKAEAGKVLYTQPGLMGASKEPRWAYATASPVQLAIEPKPAMLAFKRELDKTNVLMDISLRTAVGPTAFDWRMEANFDEELKPTSDNFGGSLHYKRVRVGEYSNGRPVNNLGLLAQHARMMKAVHTNVELDGSGNKKHHELIRPKGNSPLGSGVDTMHNDFIFSLELGTVPLPNKLVKSGDAWKADRRVHFARHAVDFDVTFTYSGTRVRGGREEAVINIAGPARSDQLESAQGQIQGHALVDLTSGLLTSAKVEARVKGTAVTTRTPVVGNLSFQLTRRPATNSAEAREVLRVQDKLTFADARDPVQLGCYRKVFKVPMKAGKIYILDMISDGNPEQSFDPYLRLEDAKGAILDEDDDSGGDLNSHLTFVASADGEYHIIATTFDPAQTGGFILTVKES